MAYPRLTPHLNNTLERLEMETPLPYQEQILTPIKSGKKLICIAPEGSGKTTSICISALLKLKDAQHQQNPRVLIFVKDKQAALDLEKAFVPFVRFSDLQVFSAFDQHDITGQKDTIYDGVDILIGTPSRLCKLFFLNGIPVAPLKLVMIEDAEFLSKNTDHIEIIRMMDSTKSTQMVIFAAKHISRFERFTDTCMPHAEVLKAV